MTDPCVAQSGDNEDTSMTQVIGGTGAIKPGNVGSSGKGSSSGGNGPGKIGNLPSKNPGMPSGGGRGNAPPRSR